MADAASTNSPRQIHEEPLLTSPNQKNAESRTELPLSNRLGVFSFCPGWKSFHIPFLRGQRSAPELPACPPAMAPACWVTSINPFTACRGHTEQHVRKVSGFVGFFVVLMARCRTKPGWTGPNRAEPGQTRPGWSPLQNHIAERCGYRSCLTKLYEQTKYRKWVHRPELRWQQPHSWGEEEEGCGGDEGSGEGERVTQTSELKQRKWLLMT